MDPRKCTFYLKGPLVFRGPFNIQSLVEQARQQLSKEASKRMTRHHTKPMDLPKLCCWQASCTREKCRFLHVEEEVLQGCRKPYKLCWDYPSCYRIHCPFVHYNWTNCCTGVTISIVKETKKRKSQEMPATAFKRVKNVPEDDSAHVEE